MTYRSASVLAWPVRRSIMTTLSAAMLAVAAVSIAVAQQPPSKPAPAAKPAAKPPAAAQQRPAAQQPAPQAQPPAQAQTQAPAAEMPQLIYSPWTKFCGKDKDPNAKHVCLTGKDARTETGVPVVAATLIEPEGETKKFFRVTLPSPLHLQFGTRIIIDQQQPMTGPFLTCAANACVADYDASPDLIGKLKKGQMLVVQAINLAGREISFPLPLVDFAKANEGPPTDPKVFEERQKKLQEELQKRAEEARKKLEAQPGSQPK
jgi:invasion protein IalB